MPYFNLLGAQPFVKRDLNARLQSKDLNRIEANKFGCAYFDGPREQGYGGYVYDGRWKKVAKEAAIRYNLGAGRTVLDIGCAKGFFVNDLLDQIPGLNAFGLDISDYALSCAPEQVKGLLKQGSAVSLPYDDNSFDAVFAINTLHNLNRQDCIRALKEINRVLKSPTQAFVQVDAYYNEKEKQLFEDWMLTAKTYCKPDEWLALFEEANYQGDYFWTTFDFSDSNITIK